MCITITFMTDLCQHPFIAVANFMIQCRGVQYVIMLIFFQMINTAQITAIGLYGDQQRQFSNIHFHVLRVVLLRGAINRLVNRQKFICSKSHNRLNRLLQTKCPNHLLPASQRDKLSDKCSSIVSLSCLESFHFMVHQLLLLYCTFWKNIRNLALILFTQIQILNRKKIVKHDVLLQIHHLMRTNTTSGSTLFQNIVFLVQ